MRLKNARNYFIRRLLNFLQQKLKSRFFIVDAKPKPELLFKMIIFLGSVYWLSENAAKRFVVTDQTTQSQIYFISCIVRWLRSAQSAIFECPTMPQKNVQLFLQPFFLFFCFNCFNKTLFPGGLLHRVRCAQLFSICCFATLCLAPLLSLTKTLLTYCTCVP